MLMGQQNQNTIGHNNYRPFDKSQKIYFNYLNSNSNQNLSNQ